MQPIWEWSGVAEVIAMTDQRAPETTSVEARDLSGAVLTPLFGPATPAVDADGQAQRPGAAGGPP